MSELLSPSRPLRLLIAAQGSAAARAIVQALGDAAGPDIELSTEPSRMVLDAADSGAEIVVLGLPTLAAAAARARSLRAATGAKLPLLLVLCAPGELAEAARLVRDGVFDDYLPHPGSGTDPDRLATSLRIAGRLARPGRPAAVARARPVVLLVEDDEFSLQLVTVTLESQNVELVTESDGAAALERIRSVRPELILMDVNLPGRDGVELTLQLKADPALAAIPVVMLTGEARREILVRSMDAGAADFIVKPFTPDALVAKLTRFLPGLR
ncbi:MAG: response regulator [Caldimonas sp.]